MLLDESDLEAISALYVRLKIEGSDRVVKDLRFGHVSPKDQKDVITIQGDGVKLDYIAAIANFVAEWIDGEYRQFWVDKPTLSKDDRLMRFALARSAVRELLANMDDWQDRIKKSD